MECLELKPLLMRRDLENLIIRYHFAREDMPRLESLYRALLPLLKVRAYSLWKPKLPKVYLENYSAAFVSLGDGIDALSEVYLKRQCVSEAYMLDCIGLELLTRAYADYAGQIKESTGLCAVKLHFIGDEYPFSLMDSMAAQMEDMDISFDSRYVMSPQKSVALFLELSAAEKMSGAHLTHICTDCKNTDCRFRQPENYNYGYQRIFGNRNQTAIVGGGK